MDNFIALGAFGSFCPSDLDVTPDNDPNSPTYNGYKDIKTMTLQDAMKLVWLFNSADFSGSVIICINGSPKYIDIPYDSETGAYSISSGANFPIS
jgi:hypothetical protein